MCYCKHSGANSARRGALVPGAWLQHHQPCKVTLQLKGKMIVAAWLHSEKSTSLVSQMVSREYHAIATLTIN